MKTIRETPDFVCDKLISKLPITSNQYLLEPSIGEGKIIKRLLDNYDLGGMTIHGIELNKEKWSDADINLSKYTGVRQNKINIKQADFLQHEFNYTYDVIISCPPFKGNVDVLHIQKMYSLLKKKGMMSTLTWPYWVTNNEHIQVEFRQWLQGKEYQFEMLPDNTFIEKEKNQPAAILTIYKR